MKANEMICIVCPKGCLMTVDEQPEGLAISGNGCKRGIQYANKEWTAPMRTLTTTVVIEGAQWRRLPVVTRGEIPKGKLFEAMAVINTVKVQGPVKMNQVIVPNLLGLGVDVVASRHMG